MTTVVETSNTETLTGAEDVTTVVAASDAALVEFADELTEVNASGDDIVVTQSTAIEVVDASSAAEVVTESAVETVVEVEPQVLIVEAAEQGPPGAQGPQGPNGSAEVYIAASAISGHIVVTLDSAGQVIPADPNTAAHGNTIIGVTVGAAIGGDPVELATSGLVTHSGWSFTVGQPVFAGTAGAITQTPPAGLWQKVIGTARTATSFVLNLQPAIFI